MFGLFDTFFSQHTLEALILVFLEIILSVDNILFLSVILQRISPQYRNRVCCVGLTLALIARIVLLLFLVELVQFTVPIIRFMGIGFSVKNIVFLLGGIFLVWKSCTEIYERIFRTCSLSSKKHVKNKFFSDFWIAILQISFIDLAFAFDSLITAVGMTDNVTIMIVSIVLSAIFILFMSRLVTTFLTKNPTMIMLALSFILILGVFLVLEGCSVKVSKKYLYVAIGFSCMVECFNRLAFYQNSK